MSYPIKVKVGAYCYECNNELGEYERCYKTSDGYVCMNCIDSYKADLFEKEHARQYIKDNLLEESKRFIVEPLEEWDEQNIRDFLDDYEDEYYDIYQSYPDEYDNVGE